MSVGKRSTTFKFIVSASLLSTTTIEEGPYVLSPDAYPILKITLCAGLGFVCVIACNKLIMYCFAIYTEPSTHTHTNTNRVIFRQ